MKITNLKYALFFSVFMLIPFLFFAQETETKKTDDFDFSAQLAMAESDYMVTAGDVYQLMFNANGSGVTYSMIVDTSYKIRVSNLAVLDVRGKTYPALKKQVEEIVMKNYPLSGVQFVLVKPALFYVTVQGEVTHTTEVRAWGLMRLDSVLANVLTPYSSVRKVQVKSSDGKTRTYDLFQSVRFGKLSQNPYVRPGDVITVGRCDRKVSINGEVERPGTYELLAGENFKSLIEYYGGGLTELADTSRITLVRNRGSQDKAGNLTYLSESDITSDKKLNNGDVITISSVSDLLPSVILEGIINAPRTDNTEEGVEQTAPANTSYRLSLKFHKGENYGTFLRRNQNLYTQYSDLENSYIERNGNRIALNIRTFIDNEDMLSDYSLEAGDRVVIPFRQYLSKIMIDGEVSSVMEEDSWPLRRLSSIIMDNLTPYSSTRKVTVTSIDGTAKTYDLFKATRYGDMEQDPYVLAGEKITVGRMERRVAISGEVERPGTYELLPGENLKALIEYYGGGLTELADTSRITLVRNRGSEDKAGNLTYHSQKDIDSDLELNNGDSIFISGTTDLQPSVIVEGIIEEQSAAKTTGNGNQSQKPADTSSRTTVKFYRGENYANFVRRIQNMFNQYSDLENSFVDRNGSRIALDIRKMLDSADFVSEYNVESGDRLVIPFRQYLSKIIITGEVSAAAEIEAWPLRRLSEVIEGHLTPYSSARRVFVTSVDGHTTEYDLFRASRFGEMEQNPYVLSGETVTVGRMERRVSISGEVERPGTYELLKGENIIKLITYYANGYTEFADSSRIEITRLIDNNNNNNIGRILYISKEDVTSDFELFLYDTVFIPSFQDLKPVAFIEGAIYTSKGTDLEASTRKEIRITNGMNYASLVRNNKDLFGATSDIKNAYIIRGDKHIPINLFDYLYDANYYSDLFVEPYDVLMIPFRQYFVSVSGAVNNPGRYPYIPDRTYDYYVGLAGGFVRSMNSGDAVTITDMEGNKLRKKDIITPECNIEAKTNSFGFFFNQYASIATTILSITTSVISIIALFVR